MKKNYNVGVIYIMFLVFYLWLAWQIPYTHDDWDWGLDVGMQYFFNASINSRYVGNFFEIVMTRSVVIKTIIMGGTYFLLPYSITNIAKNMYVKKNENTELILFLASNILLLAISKLVWQQTYGWIAGFANFAISSLFLLSIMKENFLNFDDNEGKNENLFCNIKCFLMAIAAQLFIENLAICLLIMNAVMIIVLFKKNRKIKNQLWLFFGSLIGTMVMFSSSLYGTLLSTGEAVDGYRKLSFNVKGNCFEIIEMCIKNFCSNIIPKVYSYHGLLICVIGGLIMLLMYEREMDKRICRIFLVLDLLCLLYFAVSYSNLVKGINWMIQFGFVVLFFLVIGAQLFIIYRHNYAMRNKMLILWCIPMLLMLPLSIIYEIVPRLFFPVNIMLILFVVILFSDLLENCKKKTWIATILLIISGIMVGKYIVIYHDIGQCTAERYAIIQNTLQEKGAHMVLPKYEYREYLWVPDPTSEKRMGYFKEFYKIPQSVEVEFEK